MSIKLSGLLAKLLMAHAEHGGFVVVQTILAVGAGNALFIVGMGQIVLRQGQTTSVTDIVVALGETVTDSDAAIKDETFAFPLRLVGRNGF